MYTLLTFDSLNHDNIFLSLLANIEEYGSDGKGNLHNDLFVETNENEWELWLVTNMIHGIIWHIKYSILTCSLYVISFLGFSPNIRLNAKILNVEKYNDASKLSISPYIYTIEISYGDHQWTIKRRYYFSTDKMINHFWRHKVCLLLT